MNTGNYEIADETTIRGRALNDCDGITGLCLVFRNEPIQSLSDLLRMSSLVEKLRSGHRAWLGK